MAAYRRCRCWLRPGVIADICLFNGINRKFVQKKFAVASFGSLADPELLPFIREGNRDAYAELYNRYRLPLFRFLRKYLRSDELAEDLAQNVFVKFWETRAEPVIIREPAAWLFTLAKRQALDFLRRASTEETAMAVIVSAYTFSDTEREIISRDYMAFIERVVADLPDLTKQVFRLCRQQHKTYEEAAAILGISKSTVKKHMMGSMARLKDAAEGELGISLALLLAVIAACR